MKAIFYPSVNNESASGDYSQYKESKRRLKGRLETYTLMEYEIAGDGEIPSQILGVLISYISVVRKLSIWIFIRPAVSHTQARGGHTRDGCQTPTRRSRTVFTIRSG
mgnify:CR=1 FL=1